MENELNEVIEYYSEGPNLDFKLEEYKLGNHKKKNELLKDVLAMLNHPSNKPKYIIIGILEKDGKAHEFINLDSITDQAKYQQFINSNIEPKVQFDYSSFKYQGYNLSYFKFHKNNDRPYLFSKDVKNPMSKKKEFCKSQGFIRTGSSTRILNRADLELIYYNKLKSKDRKADLKVSHTLNPYKNDKNNEFEIFTFDLCIKNTSNKSISFDLEAKIYQNDEISILKRFDLETAIEATHRRPYSTYIQNPKIDNTIILMSFERFIEYVIIRRLKTNRNSNALQISQNDQINGVLMGEILIVKHRDSKVIVDLTLRSDEFTEGSMKLTIEFDL